MAVELVSRILFERGLSNASILIKGDNQGVIGSYRCGRSRNLHVNLAIRRTEACLNVLYMLKYVEQNKADPISCAELGPLVKQITDTFSSPRS